MAADVLVVGVRNLDDLIGSVEGEFVLVGLGHLPPKQWKVRSLFVFLMKADGSYFIAFSGVMEPKSFLLSMIASSCVSLRGVTATPK